MTVSQTMRPCSAVDVTGIDCVGRVDLEEMPRCVVVDSAAEEAAVLAEGPISVVFVVDAWRWLAGRAEVPKIKAAA